MCGRGAGGCDARAASTCLGHCLRACLFIHGAVVKQASAHGRSCGLAAAMPVAVPGDSNHPTARVRAGSATRGAADGSACAGVRACVVCACVSAGPEDGVQSVVGWLMVERPGAAVAAGGVAERQAPEAKAMVAPQASTRPPGPACSPEPRGHACHVGPWPGAGGPSLMAPGAHAWRRSGVASLWPPPPSPPPLPAITNTNTMARPQPPIPALLPPCSAAASARAAAGAGTPTTAPL